MDYLKMTLILKRAFGTVAPSLSKAEPLDHRKLGQLHSLFSFNEAAPGMAFFHPAGLHVINKIKSFMRSQYNKYGFHEISTPFIYSTKLWERSGHFQNYKENMFSVQQFQDTNSEEESEKGLKPMNCPAHCLLYSQNHWSYRDLPVRYADFSALHRNEISGALSGLFRLRLFHQDDGHIFCSTAHILPEIKSFLTMVHFTLIDTFKFNNLKVYLSTRPDKSIGDLDVWAKSEQLLAQALHDSGLSFDIKEGDGAFYGPKIDVHVTDSLGRSHQLSTLQLDFHLPERFNLKYVDQNVYKTPVMIHRAVLGSLERFMAVWLESIQGKFPFWISPKQAVIIPVKDEFRQYAETVKQQLLKKDEMDPLSDEYKIDIDLSFEDTFPKRIKNSVSYNYAIVVGAKEQEKKSVSVRRNNNVESMSIEELKSRFKDCDLKFI